jgi:hypothetical protein
MDSRERSACPPVRGAARPAPAGAMVFSPSRTFCRIFHHRDHRDHGAFASFSNPKSDIKHQTSNIKHHQTSCSRTRTTSSEPAPGTAQLNFSPWRSQKSQRGEPKNWMQRRCMCVLRVLCCEKPQKSEISCLQFTRHDGPLPCRTSLLKVLQKEAKAKKQLLSCNLFDNTFVSFVAFCEDSRSLQSKKNH